jgi:hypothetical protein
MNTLAKASIVGGIVFAGFLGWVVTSIDRSPYTTNQSVVRPQPVPFSHEHHVTGLGIDCRYCHTSVTKTHYAGIPATKTCMTCHSKIWTEAPVLEPVRESWRSGRPIRWTRVHDVPDYAYFNHSIHVAKGIGCTTCHGPIDQMPLAYQYSSLQMQWCLNCHRNPEKYIRPRDEVFNVKWQAPRDQDKLGPQLVEQYHVRTEQLSDCYICHR